MLETPNKGKISMYQQLHNAKQFKLDEISKTKHYFIADIFETETMSKTFSRYNAAFGYVDNTFYVLPATVSIASFTTVVTV